MSTAGPSDRPSFPTDGSPCDLAEGRWFNEPADDAVGQPWMAAAADGNADSDRDVGLARPLLARPQSQRAVAAGGGVANENPDEQGDGQHRHEARERLRVTELSPEELAA